MTSLVALPYADLHAHDRASAGWFCDPAGALVQVAANAPRVDYDPATLAARGLLVEEAATNQLPNARQEGAGPGVLPTGMVLNGGSAGLTISGVGSGVEAGIPYSDIDITGTAVSGTFPLFQFFNTPQVPAAPGQTWTGGAYLRVITGGALPGTAGIFLRVAERAGATVHGGVVVSAAAPVGAGNLRESWRSVPNTLATAGTDNVVLCWNLRNNLAGNVYAHRLRIGAPQIWQSALSFSPSFPPIGTPGPSARAADRVTRTLGHRFSRSAFTMLTRGLFAQAAPAGMTRGVLQIDDGTNANRIRIENTPGGSALRLVVTTGGVDTATLALGSMTPGTPFGVAFACADGDIAAVRNGGTIQTAAVAVPPGLAFMRVGAVGFDHANLMNGWIRAHRLMRGRLDNDALITMAA